MLGTNNGTRVKTTAGISLSKEDFSDLSRYIDVKKGELYTAKGVVFVEGISEEYLVPSFAKAKSIDFDRLGVVVCNINAINFKPYLEFVGALGIPRQTFRTTELIVWLQKCAKWVIDKESTSFDDICFTWKSFIEQKELLIEEEFLTLRRLLYKSLTESELYKDNLSKWLCYICDKVDIINIFANSEKFPNEIENLQKLNDWIDNSTIPMTTTHLAQLGTPENQVVLSTRHSSKGLEFDIVIMLGMEKDSFPSYYDNTTRKLDEAKRLCFVSISRARKKCILIRSRQLPNNNGRWFSKDPSPFWIALQEFQKNKNR